MVATDLLRIVSPGGLVAEVMAHGARLAALHVPDRAGRMADILLGHDRPEDWLASPAYFGATCGRHANRIAGAAFHLDGLQHRLVPNEGTTQLHGGPAGFDRKDWQVTVVEPGRVTFATQAADGEMGYPGRLSARCTYRFDAGDRLWIEMEAETAAPTVVNLVNHAYFNLAGEGDVLGQHLRLAADHYTPVDHRLIPTGEVRAVEGTPFDFRHLRAIGAEMPDPSGFDHNFCLSEPLLPVAGALLRDCAEAVDPASGRRLRLWTDAPGVQIYTAGRMNAGRGKGGAALGHFAGFTLETQGFPDAPNRPQFPSTRLDPGQVWRHRMLFSFAPAE